MRKIIRIIIWVQAILLSGSCSPAAEDPGNAAKSFLDAFAAKDFETASKFATKDSKTLIDLVKSMMELQGDFNISAAGLDKESLKNAVYENQEIEGDNATVKVIAGNRSHIIKLKKEDGAWKVAMDKQTLEETVADETNTPKNEFNKTPDNIPLPAVKATEDSNEAIDKNGNNPKDTLMHEN